MMRSYLGVSRWMILTAIATVFAVASLTESAQAQFRRPTGSPAIGAGRPASFSNFVTPNRFYNAGIGSFATFPNGTFASQMRGTAVRGNVNLAFVQNTVGLNLGNGVFVPTASYAVVTGNSNVPYNPYVQQAQVQAANIRGYGQAVNSAYLSSIYGYNPSWFVTPYWNGPYHPYYQPYYYPQSYGTPYGYGSPTAAPVSSVAAAPAPAPKAPAAVAAFGIPANDDGSVAWPFAFRLMAPDARREFLDPLDTQLQIATKQAAAGKASPNVLREAHASVDRLYQWLRTHRLDLAEGSVRDANVFLGRIDAALRALRPEA